MQQVRIENDFESWRRAARRLLQQSISPENVLWRETGLSHALLPGLAEDAADEAPPSSTAEPLRVPKEFIVLSRFVACHRDDARWALLYRALWRIAHGQPRLLEISVDDDVHRLLMMEKSVRFEK